MLVYESPAKWQDAFTPTLIVSFDTKSNSIDPYLDNVQCMVDVFFGPVLLRESEESERGRNAHS